MMSKREAEACDGPAQLAEQERRTQSGSPGWLSVELLPDSSPSRPLGDSDGTAQLGRPVDQTEASQPPPLHGADDADSGSQGALDDVRGVAVARMRFCEIPDPAVSAVRAHLVDDLSERLADATAEYFADTGDNQARILFETPGSLGPEEVSAVLDRCQQKLVDLIKAPVEQLATAGGAPQLAAEVAGGISADFVLAREIPLGEGMSAMIDICVIGIGYATGQPHLVAVAVKHLSHTGFHEAVQRGASKILECLRKPAAPSAPVPAPHVTLPLEIELDSPRSALPGPRDKPNQSLGF